MILFKEKLGGTDMWMWHKKKIISVIGMVLLVLVLVTVVGRRVPIHPTLDKVGNKRIYYRETSRFIMCSIAYFDVVVTDDGTMEYYYELIPIGNGSCFSEPFVWDGFQSYRLSEAIEEEIVSIDDFMESDLVKERTMTEGDE